jgi:cytochrome c
MDQLEFTKFAAAILLPLLLIFGFKTIVDSRVSGPPAKPGFTLPVADAAPAAPPAEKTAAAAEAKPAEGAAPAKEAAAAAPAADAGAAVVAALAKANADNGKAVFAKCKACHNAEKGKPKGVGPNLWGVINRAKGSSEGFEYSPAMKAKGGNWTFEEMAAFISNPKGFLTGTKMVFNGLPNPADAADVIAYLATQSDTPVALPK